MSRSDLNPRMTATDAAFIYAENEQTPMHIGCIEVVEGTLPVQSFINLVDSKLRYVPRYRQIMRPAPLGLGHPSWHDDPSFDVNNHIDVVQLEAPGDEAAFKRLTSRLFAGMLDRTRPLWKIFVIEGREDGNTGLMWLVHHAMVDGISGTGIVETVLDISPATAIEKKESFTPAALPSGLRALGGAIADTTRAQWNAPRELASKALAQARRIRKTASRATASESGPILRDLIKPVPRLPFSTRIFSGERLLSWGSCSIADIKAIREACGGTLNDVVLAALGGAAREYMKAHGIRTQGKTLRAACPVSLRDEEHRDALGNQVTIMPVDIPLDTTDPVARLQQVTRRTTALKALNVAHGIDLATVAFQTVHPRGQSLAIGAFVAPGLGRLADRLPGPPMAHMVCTNVPGPRVALYAAGHRILSHVPLLPVVPGMGLAMGVFSYAGTIHFGYIADANAAPDVDRFAKFVDASFAELLRAATGKAPRAGVEEKKAKPARRRRATISTSRKSGTKSARANTQAVLMTQRRRTMAASPK